MTIQYRVFDQQLSESLSSYVSRLDTYLQSLGGIGLQDVALSRRLDISVIRYELTLQYATNGPLTFRAAYFSGSTDAEIAADVAAFFAALPSARIHQILDVSQEQRRSLVLNAVCVLYADTIIPNCGSNRSRPIIVQAVANILAGAAGACLPVTATGTVATAISVTNRSGFTWLAGTRGYANSRIGDCTWDGWASCC